MSFRNGDRSRENRLRKAREKKRATIRKVKSKLADKTPTKAVSK
jgi:hypothetical protein